ncbi:hypothetical protein H072_1359 [Dactylellina haptotyla CBS 200.50]|uniref:HMG box domain-containing protein n=1 Tax=Dactylellina haptotyla (strain CBS 200.50) TaxID=1284197 RepID=S8ANY7_DACHA|nr:hypothetical protein H072_1359 [Dactylellina haptotyla CBS 200.50]
MLTVGRPQRVRKPSGSSSPLDHSDAEEIYKPNEHVGAFTDRLVERRCLGPTTKEDMCVDTRKAYSFERRLRMNSEDDGSTCSTSSSRTGRSEGTSHTSFELSEDPYSPPVTVLFRDKTAPTSSYPTPQPISKPETPVRDHKMQRFPSLSGVDLSVLPPTPVSLRTTPTFGVEMSRKRRLPSPEILSATEEERKAVNVDVRGCIEGDEWEDVEDEDEDEGGTESTGTVYDEDVEFDGTASDLYEEIEDNRMGSNDDVDINNNTDEALSDPFYTPKLRAKYEASPDISPILEPSNLPPLSEPLTYSLIDLTTDEPTSYNSNESSLVNEFLTTPNQALHEFPLQEDISNEDIKTEMPPFLRISQSGPGPLLEMSNERKLPIAEPPARNFYKAACSIPTYIPHSQYADECLKAAFNSRLSPYQLQDGESSLLGYHLNHLHVTTYLNIRNGILRLWHKNPRVRVSRYEAAGCAKDARFFSLADVAYDWLNRNGYINHGCIALPPRDEVKKKPATRRKKVIAIVGAGISGLATARQLESLLAQYGEKANGPDTPDVVIFEGRHRLGGRVYTQTLSTGDNNLPEDLKPGIDLGGQIVMGYEGGNPLAALIQSQLKIPFHAIDNTTAFPLYDYDGTIIKDGRDEVLQKVHDDILDRLAIFKAKHPPVVVVEGNHGQIDACKDPWGAGGLPFAVVQKLQDNRASTETPYTMSANTNQELPSSKTVRKRIGKRKSSGPGNTGLPATKKIKLVSKKIDKDALQSLPIDPQKVSDENGFSSLGKSMDKMFPGYSEILKPDARDLRIYNWFHANLEYCNASAINKPSLEHWDQDDGNEFSGAHSMIVGGYSQLAKGLFQSPTKLDVRMGYEVVKIKHDPGNKDKGVTLRFRDGSEFTADKVIVTLPLGVLKKHSVQFDPPLSISKQSAIDRLGFGLLNKVIMVYDKPFWDTTRDGFGCLRKAEGDEDLLSSYEAKRGRFYMWWNATNAAGRPTLVGLMVGDAAENIEEEADEELITEATSILKRCWGEHNVPNEPQEAIVTRWRQDRFACGTYSYIAAGSTGDDYDLIAEPVDDQIFFAGEHTNRHHPATVHGAYISGLRVASEVLNSVLGPIRVPKPLIKPRIIKNKIVDAVESVVSVTSIVTRHQKFIADNLPETKKRTAPDEIKRESFKRSRVSTPRSETQQEREEQQNAHSESTRPKEPVKGTTNPFLIYQKTYFPIAKAKADILKQGETENPNAKADRDEVRVVLGKMWRDEPDERKKPYKDQVDRNKVEYQQALIKYKQEVGEWQGRSHDIGSKTKSKEKKATEAPAKASAELTNTATVGLPAEGEPMEL